MDPRSKAIELVHAADALILDFDGPVCDVFAGFPASKVAAELSRHFGFGIQTDDPLDLLRFAVESDRDAEAVDQLLTEYECQAIQRATETPGARSVIRAFDGPVAIASNNGRRPIEIWLAGAGLSDDVAHVEGRRPHSMKPDPRALVVSAECLGANVDSCVFIGDSTGDLQAANAIRMSFIAFAPSPRKIEHFFREGCGAIVDSMESLATPPVS